MANARNRGLTDSQKRRADIILGLYQTACTNFERRRAYEWKLSFGIWTALAAFTGLTMREKNAARDFGCAGWVVFGVLAVIIFALHFCFQWRIMISNAVDQNRALLFEQVLRKLVRVRTGDLPSTAEDKIDKETEDRKLHEKAGDLEEAIARLKCIHKCCGWLYIAIHLGITGALLGAAFLSLLLAR